MNIKDHGSMIDYDDGEADILVDYGSARHPHQRFESDLLVLISNKPEK